MSTSDQATAAFIAELATAGDGVVIGLGFAICAAASWIRYLASSAALRRIKNAPSVRIPDLRSLLSDGSDEKLVVVRGRVQPRPASSFDAAWSIGGKNHGGALISQGSGQRAVVVQQIQTCLYNEGRAILGWRLDLHAILAKSWKEQKSSSLRSVPFILVEGSQWPNSGYVHVSTDGSAHPLPLTTVYHQLHPVQPTAYTFFQILFGTGYPVALLDEEKILPVGKEITAVGICRMHDGALEIRSCAELPFFLSDKSKGEIEVDLASNSQFLFWTGIILGAFSISILGFAAIRNWRRFREWRRRQRHTQELRNEAQVQNSSEEELGDVPDGQLCVVCLTRQRRSAFVPCGHLVCCPRCANSVEVEPSPKCPVCRQSVRSSIRIYDS